jgi:hypothetical protein
MPRHSVLFWETFSSAETTRRDAFCDSTLGSSTTPSSCRLIVSDFGSSLSWIALDRGADLECQGHRAGTDQLNNGFNNRFSIYFILSNNYIFQPIIAIYRRAIIVSCQAYQLS